MDIHVSSQGYLSAHCDVVSFLLHPHSLTVHSGEHVEEVWETCAIPDTKTQTLFFPWQTQPVCRTAPKAITLMRTATGVSPATALVGHVKGDIACNASPADQAGSSWERSACPSAGKGKLLGTLLSDLIP